MPGVQHNQRRVQVAINGFSFSFTSSTADPTKGCKGLKPFPADTRQETGYTLDRSPVSFNEFLYYLFIIFHINHNREYRWKYSHVRTVQAARSLGWLGDSSKEAKANNSAQPVYSAFAIDSTYIATHPMKTKVWPLRTIS